MEEKLKQEKTNCVKIVLFGPESTGKTTLAKQLAQHYNSLWVPEFSRKYAEKKLSNNQQLSKEDVLPIAIGQMKLENSLAKREKKVLICDTNILETKVYAMYIYNGYCPETINKGITQSTYHLYLLTATDIPWEYDAVRSSNANRKKMFAYFENTLKSYGFPYTIIKGSETERLKKAIKHIDLVLKKQP